MLTQQNKFSHKRWSLISYPQNVKIGGTILLLLKSALEVHCGGPDRTRSYRFGPVTWVVTNAWLHKGSIFSTVVQNGSFLADVLS